MGEASLVLFRSVLPGSDTKWVEVKPTTEPRDPVFCVLERVLRGSAGPDWSGGLSDLGRQKRGRIFIVGDSDGDGDDDEPQKSDKKYPW